MENLPIIYEQPAVEVRQEPTFFQRLGYLLKPSSIHQLLTGNRNVGRILSVAVKDQWAVDGEKVVGDFTPAEYVGVFEQEPWIFACCSAIATDSSGLPIKLMDDERQPVPRPWPLELSWIDTPNEWQGMDMVLKSAIYDYLLVGAAYIYWTGYEMYRLPAWAMKVIPDKEDRISKFIHEVNGRKETYSPDEVIYIPHQSPVRTVLGMSQLAPLRDTLQKAASQVRYEKGLWKNNARVSGLLQTNMAIPEDQRVEMGREWNTKYSGAHNAGKTAILSHGLTYQQVALSPTEAGYESSRNQNREEIHAALGVPPVRTGLQDQKYANAREQMGMYWRSTVAPLCRLFSDSISRKVFAKEKRYWFWIDVESSYYSAWEKEQLYDLALRATGNKAVLTQNEGRKMIGVPEHDDPEADQLNHAPPPMFPALPNATERLPNVNVLADTSEAEEGDTEERAIANIITRATVERAQSHQKTLNKELDICRKDVAIPLLDVMEEANIEAINALRSIRSQHLRDKGELLEIRQIEPHLPDPSSFNADLQADLHEYLLGCYKRVGDEALKQLINQKRSMRAIYHRQEETGVVPEFDINDPLVLEQILQREQLITSVPASVQDQVRLVVAQGIEQGKSYDEIARDIRDLFSGLRDWEALRIAQTESAYGANNSNEIAMHEARVKTGAWVHSGNPNGRINHIRNQAQGEVALGMPFSNGMTHPHQEGAPPSETIHCQCVHVAVTFE